MQDIFFSFRVKKSRSIGRITLNELDGGDRCFRSPYPGTEEAWETVVVKHKANIRGTTEPSCERGFLAVVWSVGVLIKVHNFGSPRSWKQNRHYVESHNLSFLSVHWNTLTSNVNLFSDWLVSVSGHR